MSDTIDCLTVVHLNIDFNDAEKAMIKHDIGNGLILNVVDYDYLKKDEAVNTSSKRLV